MSTTADETSSSGGSSSSFSADIIEERFRVDRRKLESLMTSSGPDDPGVCPLEKFFRDIEAKTGARVAWPSKLKVGAKSKRDPQVKISGSPEAVQCAKALVLSHCSRKFSKLTLRIDVPHNEHSQLIGRHGALQKEIKSRTGTDIHFPDSNKSSASPPAAVAALAAGASIAECASVKSNQVSLNGLEGSQPTGMELARRMIRAKQPLSLLLLLPSPVPDPSEHAYVRHICELCKVCVTRQQAFGHRQAGGGWTIRGPVENAEAIAIAVEQLCLYAENLFSLAGLRSAQQQFLVSCRLDFERRHAAAVRERLQLDLLALSTAIAGSPSETNFLKATLKRFGVSQFDLTDTGAVMSEAGGCRALLRLRSFLLACLPAFLCFDMPCNALAIEDSLIESLKGRTIEGVTVDVAIRRGGGGPTASRSVTLRTHEGNAQAMYRLLNRIFATPIPDSSPEQVAPTGATQALVMSPSVATAPSFSQLPQSPAFFIASPTFLSAQEFQSPVPSPPASRVATPPFSHLPQPSTTLILASPPIASNQCHQPLPVPPLTCGQEFQSPVSPPSTTTSTTATTTPSPRNQSPPISTPPLSPRNRAPGAEREKLKAEKLIAERIMSRPQPPVGDRRPTDLWSGRYFSRSCAARPITASFNAFDNSAAAEVPATPTSTTPQSSSFTSQPNPTCLFAQSCYQPLAQLSSQSIAATGFDQHQHQQHHHDHRPAAAPTAAAAVSGDNQDDSIEALLNLLDRHNLVECASAMIKEDVDLGAFRNLTSEDLVKLGFSFSTRQKLQQLIHSLAASQLTL